VCQPAQWLNKAEGLQRNAAKLRVQKVFSVGPGASLLPPARLLGQHIFGALRRIEEKLDRKADKG
jgi:hypothetical protein